MELGRGKKSRMFHRFYCCEPEWKQEPVSELGNKAKKGLCDSKHQKAWPYVTVHLPSNPSHYAQGKTSTGISKSLCYFLNKILLLYSLTSP